MLEDTTNLDDKTINKLNDLIRLNIDSSKGFAEASQEVGDPEVRSVFQEIGPQRSANAEELKKYVRWSNEKPAESGTLSGAAHRLWLDLRAKLSRNEAQAVLEEAERGEDVIKHTYEDVLVETAGSAVNDVLQRQYASVKHGHDRIRDLRDRYRRHGR